MNLKVDLKKPRLAIVVPCYNEEEVLDDSVTKLVGLLKQLVQKEKIAENSFIYLCDDGSIDNTWKIISRMSSENALVGGIKLAKNTGHQNVLIAGLLALKDTVDCSISIDADLQDDIAVIEEMIDRYSKGYEIVFGVRQKRDTDSIFKKFTALGFYKIMKILGVEIINNHADFRLMGNKALNALSKYKEINLFLRGICKTLGFKTTCVYYDRLDRTAGETKYPLPKMLSFAWNGITSFSSVPLRFITFMGVVLFFGTMIASLWVLISKFFIHNVIPGWTSIVLPIFTLGGIQLLAIGIIGEYLAKMYLEIKQRPRFIIEEKLDV